MEAEVRATVEEVGTEREKVKGTRGEGEEGNYVKEGRRVREHDQGGR